MNKIKKKQVAVLAILMLIGMFVIVNFTLFGEEKEENTITYYFNTVTYYFNAYDEGEEWAIDPQEMCDGDTERWAQTNQSWESSAQDLIQHLTANTCDGTDLGIITKVEIRSKVDGPYSPPNINYVILRPIFNNQDGSDFQITVIGTMWSEWFDITSPFSWMWDDVVNLDCDVEADVGLSFIKCAIVEIQVSFETETSRSEPMDILDDQPEEQEDEEKNEEEGGQENEEQEDEDEQEVIERPTVEIIDIDIMELSTDEATIDITVVVRNPNSVGGIFNEISYTLYFKDERLRGSGEYEFLGSSVIEQGMAIETGENILHVFFTLKNKAILQSLVTLAVQGQVWIKVEGIANLDLKETSYDIPFEQEVPIIIRL